MKTKMTKYIPLKKFQMKNNTTTISTLTDEEFKNEVTRIAQKFNLTEKEVNQAIFDAIVSDDNIAEKLKSCEI